MPEEVVSSTKHLVFIKEDDKHFIVRNKSKIFLGSIEWCKEWSKFTFSPNRTEDLQFDETCQDNISSFLAKLNKKRLMATPLGRPKGFNYKKHGFYLNKMKPCNSCPKMKDESCPYFHRLDGKEHLHQLLSDEFGVYRCVPEFKYFQNLKETFSETYKLTKADKPLMEKMCMILVRAARVEEYLADEGLVQIKNMKDDKTGEIKEVTVQNMLKKDAYFDDKIIREWLDNLNLSRKNRLEEKEERDFAIVLTKKIEVKGNKQKAAALINKIKSE